MRKKFLTFNEVSIIFPCRVPALLSLAESLCESFRFPTKFLNDLIHDKENEKNHYGNRQFH